MIVQGSGDGNPANTASVTLSDPGDLGGAKQGLASTGPVNMHSSSPGRPSRVWIRLDTLPPQPKVAPALDDLLRTPGARSLYRVSVTAIQLTGLTPASVTSAFSVVQSQGWQAEDQ